MPVKVINRQRRMKVPADRIREVLLRVMAEELGGEVEVNVMVVANRRIEELNRRFLRYAGPTDVIAFPMADDEDDVFGDIVVSAQMATDEASKRGLAPEDELLLYAVHGMLHLCGYDDRTPAAAAKMQARAEEIVKANRV